MSFTVSFICQLCEEDWIISRGIGVCGNREGSIDENGKAKYFKTDSGIIQSIIEDLISMRKGDMVFFHVIKAKDGISSIHGVYKISSEAFYGEKHLWKSSPHLLYPYRFLFEPHPDHKDLCDHDSNILVSEFYKAMENREIRSIVTLEREVNGAAHAIKTITDEDAYEIIKLLYRDFGQRAEKTKVEFKPIKIRMTLLRNKIERIGEIEFPIKALIAYHLRERTPNIINLIPACRSGCYDFLVESFMGQTVRKPVDIMCIGKEDSKKAVTILEAKVDKAGMEDLVQSLKYLLTYKSRNTDRKSSSFEMSVCLLAKRFSPELINYASLRNQIVSWEEMVLLKYLPCKQGTDAIFSVQDLIKSSLNFNSLTYPCLNVGEFLREISVDPLSAYKMLGNIPYSNASLDLESTGGTIILNKYCLSNCEKSLITKVFVRIVKGQCTLASFQDFLRSLNTMIDTTNSQIAVEPVIVADSFDDLISSFLKDYNIYEAKAKNQLIKAYISSKAKVVVEKFISSK